MIKLRKWNQLRYWASIFYLKLFEILKCSVTIYIFFWSEDQLFSRFFVGFIMRKDLLYFCLWHFLQAIETPLLPHQKQALAWMVSRENSEELPPFWEQRSDLHYNTITNFSEKDRPENVHGGILADDMGLVIIFLIKFITFYFLTKFFF